MSPSEQEGAAAAARLLGSMSLGESVERIDNDAGHAKKNGTTKKFCSACGKKSDAVKMCNGCKCVWYCDQACRDKHRKDHKHECRRIKKELDKRGGKLDLGTELNVGPLGKLPPQEECPICMRMMPLDAQLRMYFPCCGKNICGGCDLQHWTKSKERPRTCAFCRTSFLESNEEEALARLRKRVDLKDPKALCEMAMSYCNGNFGLLVDEAKCIQLLRKSADLGFPDAQYKLAAIYHKGEMGLQQNRREALKYEEKAAEGGDIFAQHSIGCSRVESGDFVAAMRHLRLSASGGHKNSSEGLIAFFEKGLLRRADLAETLRAFYCARAEMKSEERNAFIKYLKRSGKYKHEQYL